MKVLYSSLDHLSSTGFRRKLRACSMPRAVPMMASSLSSRLPRKIPEAHLFSSLSCVFIWILKKMLSPISASAPV